MNAMMALLRARMRKLGVGPGDVVWVDLPGHLSGDDATRVVETAGKVFDALGVHCFLTMNTIVSIVPLTEEQAEKLVQWRLVKTP